ncbi:MAG TPA: TonB-dependent receptor, partial [Bacteroidetes bacterium]|nr:TonB-dependent receptor [Bacteroidota bacterium]
MKAKTFIQLFIPLILVFSTYITNAQKATIKGNVSDESSGLVSATVKIVGTDYGTITNFDGDYELSVDPGTYKVEASYVGYNSDTKDITVEAGKTYTLDFKLSEGIGLSEVVVIGSRNANRTATQTPVPVDVIDMKKLTNLGPQTDVNQILNYVAPSFSSNTQTVADGTDHIDPASLRGLGPDQVLVLINGKRRHNSSLVNVNGTVGSGSVGTDMNAIPTAAIERIEVLRDGAAAQYGSDAMAGVINIVLKKSANQLNVSLTSGAQMSKNSNNFEGGMDGEKVQLDVNYGLPLGDKGGFINMTGSFNTRGAATRNKPMGKSIFLGYNAVERVANADGYDISNL